MSTLIEIQDAVAQLPSNEKKALQIWLNSQTETEMTAQEEQCLLRSLDEAMRDIDAGANFVVASLSTRRLQGIAPAAKSPLWFQLYDLRKEGREFVRGVVRCLDTLPASINALEPVVQKGGWPRLDLSL